MIFVRSVALIVAAASWCVPAEAQAQQRHRISLPAGRLSTAIVMLGQQANISIGISDRRLGTIRVNAVSGNLTVRDALDRLLRGTGARAVFVDSATVRIVGRAVSREARSAARRAPPPRRVPPRVPAATASPPALETEDIVVTAAKRPFPMSQYPGPVTMLGGDDEALNAGVPNSETLVLRLPALSSTHLGTGRNKLFVRGVADSSFPGPTQSTVGQYFGETRLNFNAPDPDLRLYDLERIELLPGPQGTLYGAGSMGGIIRVVPHAPHFGGLEGVVTAAASLTQHGAPGFDGAAVLNVPLVSDRAALRLVGYGVSEGGYIDDIFRGLEDVNSVSVLGGRAALRTRLGSGWTLDLTAVAQSIRGDDAQYGDINSPPLTRRSAADQGFANDYWLAQVVAENVWGEHRLVLAGSAVRQDLRETYDLGGLTLSPVFDPTRPPLIVKEGNKVSLLSFEGRLSRQRDDGTGWLVGASLISNQSDQVDVVGSAKLTEFARVPNDIVDATLFGDGTLRLLPWLRATIGGRLDYSRITGPAPGTAGEVAGGGAPVIVPTGERSRRSKLQFLPSLALSAELRPNLLLFARYQQAFRPGGVQFSGNTLVSFEDDKVEAVEGGLRYGAPGRGRFDGSVSVAYTRWTHIQADIVNSFGRAVTSNIGDGRIYTLDVNLGWRPMEGLAMNALVVLNDSRIADPKLPPLFFGQGPLDGSPLPNVAAVNAAVTAEYRTDLTKGLEGRLWAAARHAGKSILGIGTPLDQPQGQWTNLNLGARLSRGRHALGLDLTNVLDVQGNRFAFGSPYTFLRTSQLTPLRPRTIRISYEIAF